MRVRILRGDHLRLVLAALAAIFATGAPANAASPGGEFPYIAYVVEPDSYVRSGPGREHYPTSQLPAGYAVEVYRHDGAGWCAIRPPENSFSVAPLHQLRMLDERTAQVTADGVVARVGSTLGAQPSAVQVMLTRGETVGLVERPSPTNPWVRIAPPAGEFRWIAARRLSRTPPTETAALVTNDAGWQSHTLTRAGAAAASHSGLARDDAELMGGDAFAHLRAAAPSAMPGAVVVAAAAGATAPWQARSTNNDPSGSEVARGATSPSGDAGIQIVPGSPADIQQTEYQQVPEGVTGTAPPGEQTVPAPPSPPPRVRFEGQSARGPLDPRVAEMQLRLSQIVIGEPATWQFAALREETAALLAAEPSVEVRDQLRDLLDRIATFETVQGRYRNQPAQLASNVSGAPGAAGAPAPANGAPPGTLDNADVLARVRSDLGVDNSVSPTPGVTPPAAAEALYDAVGTLKPVVSRRQNAPQFALVDDHGDVVTFVTSAPDVNLQAYVGQRIGVRGSRGFMPEFRRAHVTASRITPLEQTLTR